MDQNTSAAERGLRVAQTAAVDSAADVTHETAAGARYLWSALFIYVFALLDPLSQLHDNCAGLAVLSRVASSATCPFLCVSLYLTAWKRSRQSGKSLTIGHHVNCTANYSKTQIHVVWPIVNKHAWRQRSKLTAEVDNKKHVYTKRNESTLYRKNIFRRLLNAVVEWMHTDFESFNIQRTPSSK